MLNEVEANASELEGEIELVEHYEVLKKAREIRERYMPTSHYRVKSTWTNIAMTLAIVIVLVIMMHAAGLVGRHR